MTYWPVKINEIKNSMGGATMVKLKKGGYESCDIEASMRLDFSPPRLKII